MSLNKFCVEIIKIEKKEEKKSNFFCFEFFLIDVLFNYRQHCQKENSKKKKKMFFEVFNQYRKNRSIFDESDAELIQEILAKKELSKSTFREKKTAFVTKEILQFRFSTTISSLQVLQMLLRWLIIMLASKTFETFFFDDYNITKFLDRYANLCLNYDLEKKEKIRRLFQYCDFINE